MSRIVSDCTEQRLHRTGTFRGAAEASVIGL
jgi:hypothetical protein